MSEGEEITDADWEKAERKKKKKSKKKDGDEAPLSPEEVEPEQDEDREAELAGAEADEWPPLEEDEAPVGEGAPAGEGFDDFEHPQQIEKKKSAFPVFWNRPKARMYKMNFDYGENYYSNMVAYLNSRAGSTYRNTLPPPRAESWAERALKSANLRYPRQEADLGSMLASVRSNIRDYDMHHRRHTARTQSMYGGIKAM